MKLLKTFSCILCNLFQFKLLGLCCFYVVQHDFDVFFDGHVVCYCLHLICLIIFPAYLFHKNNRSNIKTTENAAYDIFVLLIGAQNIPDVVSFVSHSQLIGHQIWCCSLVVFNFYSHFLYTHGFSKWWMIHPSLWTKSEI